MESGAGDRHAAVLELAAFFRGEAGEASGLPRGGDPRRELTERLTMRPPAPLPLEVSDELDWLLRSERDAGRVVDAKDLPTLSQTGLLGGDFARRTVLWEGDLTTLRADAIVNAANSAMLGCFIPGHQCIDNAIHRVAGPGLRLECATYMSGRQAPEDTGSAVLTAGYNLPAEHVIHTVGPIVRDGRPTEGQKAELASCYVSILDLAQEAGLSSVGLCAISTGVFGFPKEAAAAIAVRTIAGWLSEHPESVVRPVIAAFSDMDRDLYIQAIGRHGHGSSWQ